MPDPPTSADPSPWHLVTVTPRAHHTLSRPVSCGCLRWLRLHCAINDKKTQSQSNLPLHTGKLLAGVREAVEGRERETMSRVKKTGRR
eukprot:3842785-Rhodomonas_salina.1